MKNLLKKLVLTTICFIVLGQLTYAQTQSMITGTAVDSISKSPIPFLTVKLLGSNKAIVKAMVANENGEFKIESVPAGKYQLNLASIDHQLKEMNLEITGKNLPLGEILMAPQSNNIKQVEIVANKKIVSRDIDKLTYDLEADPESKNLDALNMMRKIPYLSVDGNEDILLKGKSDYKILVNGRPSSMMERDAKNILKNMPASNISKIEVITNPSAKYDAEGVAGIINIITTKKLADGYSATLSASERFPVGGPSVGGSLILKSSKFGLSTNGNTNYSNSPNINSYNSLISVANNNALTQNGQAKSDSRGGYISGELSYEIDSLQLLTGSFNYNKNRSNSFMSQQSELVGQQTILERYNLNNNGLTNGNGKDFSVNYQLGFKRNKNQILTFSYRGYDYNTDFTSNQVLTNQINYNSPDFRQNNLGTVAEQTAQIDYVQPFKKLNIEAGVKSINRKNKGDFIYDYLDIITSTYVIDPQRTNIYTNDQWILGAYNSYSYKLNKMGFRVGMRLEKTDVDANFISNNTNVVQNYWSFLPSISFNTSLTDNQNLNFNFSQRINRAGINKLNPFVDRSNPNFETAGNPDLKAARINSIDGEYSYYGKVSATIGLNVNFAKGMFLPISTFDPLTQITRSTFANIGKIHGIGLNFYYSMPISKKWQMSTNGGGEYISLTAPVNGLEERTTIFMSRFSVNSSYTIKKGWRLNGNANFRSSSPTTLQGRASAFMSTSFSTSADILQNKITLSASINNPFNKYRDNLTETLATDFNQRSIRYEYFRGFSVSAFYKFGKLKESIKKGKRGIRNDDFSN